MMTGCVIPESWAPPRWLSGPNYSKRELMWLCERLDASNRELRIVNRRLSEMMMTRERTKMQTPDPNRPEDHEPLHEPPTWYLDRLQAREGMALANRPCEDCGADWELQAGGEREVWGIDHAPDCPQCPAEPEVVVVQPNLDDTRIPPLPPGTANR